MSTHEYKCPSCGAGLHVENRFSKTIVCGYCGQTSFISHNGLDPAGKQAALAEFPSVFAVGKIGKLLGSSFRVLGRLRYTYDDGFWDEWFLSLDEGKKFVWLQEDEGDLTAFSKEPITASLPPFSQIKVGSIVDLGGKKLFVTEKNQAAIAGGEGELNFRFNPGQKVDCVDGNAGGQLMSVEFMPEEINLSVGTPVSFDEIEFGEG